MCFIARLLLPLVLLLPTIGFAQDLFTDEGALVFQTSLWTKHYSEQSDHNNHQQLINLEYYLPPDNQPFKHQFSDWRDDLSWLVGAATFKNSYDQQSLYIYGGSRYDWPVSENTTAYAKLTAGLLWGYRGEYKDKIPFNHFGIAPVALPAFGVQYRKAHIELLPFAAAGMMINIGWRFD